MGILPKFLRNRNKTTTATILPKHIPVPEAKVSDEIEVIDRKTQLPKRARAVAKIGLEYGGAKGRELRFLDPEYNLSEVAAAMDTEAYFRRSIDKYIEHIWKQGFKIVGKDDKAVKYIRRRLMEIARVTGMPTWQLLEDIAGQLVPYANCFIVKKRDPQSSSGGIRINFDGKALDPVAGYFVLDATSIKIARDTHGTVKKYEQYIEGNPEPAKKFNPINMIHIYTHRKIGLAAGTPMVTPVLDDIRALRRMEEGIEILIFQHAIPLFHYTVGTDESPALDEEIQLLKTTIQDMPSNGVIVTPERHDIQAIGAEGRSVRAEGYLTYFKQRVWAGLGMSGVSFGEGDTANRSTAMTMDGNVQDTSRKFQQCIKQFFNEYVINELLLEGEFEIDDTSEDRLVELFIPEIDLDTKTKVEAHNLLQFQGNALSHDELREAMGKDPMSDEEWKNTQWELVDKNKALIQSIDELSPFGKKDMTSGPTPAVKNASQPKNQHGTKTGTKPPVNVNSEEICAAAKSDVQLDLEDSISVASETLFDRLKYSELAEMLLSRYDTFKTDLMNIVDKSSSDKELAITKSAALVGLNDTTLPYILTSFKTGIIEFSRDAQLNPFVKDETPYINLLKAQITTYFNKFIEDISERIDDESDPSIIHATMDSMAFRLDFHARTSLMKAYNVGYALAARDANVAALDILVFGSDMTHNLCTSHGSEIRLREFNPDELPPLHTNCVCQVKFRS